MNRALPCEVPMVLPQSLQAAYGVRVSSDALPAVVRDFHKDRHHAPPAIVFVHPPAGWVRPERGTGGLLPDFLLRLPRRRPSLARRGAAGTTALPHGERL